MQFFWENDKETWLHNPALSLQLNLKDIEADKKAEMCRESKQDKDCFYQLVPVGRKCSTVSMDSTKDISAFLVFGKKGSHASSLKIEVFRSLVLLS